MKFGNYNINTVVHDSKPSKFDSLFRLDKLKLSTPNFLTRFHNRIETFRRLNSRCESPISYRASLFDSSAAAAPAARAEHAPARHPHANYYRPSRPPVLVPKFHANDFPNKPATATNSDNFYVFGNQIRKIGIVPSQRAITGRNYLVQPDRRKIAAWPPAAPKVAASATDAAAAAAASDLAAKRSRIRRQNSTLKDMLNTTTLLDEDVEFKVLKDYFETTSYSEIVRDPDFKDYLNRKNYGDILDYLNADDGEVASTSTLPQPSAREMPIKARPTSSAIGLSKSRSTGHLYESLSLYDNYDRPDAYLLRNGASHAMPGATATMPSASHRLCNSLKRIRRAFKPTPLEQPTPPPAASVHHLYRQHHHRPPHQHSTDHRRTRCERLPAPLPPACCADRYEDIKRFCQLLFEDNQALDDQMQSSGSGAASLGRHRSYSDKNYKKLLQRFVRTKGFDTVDAYVYAKFGQLLDQTVGYNLMVAGPTVGTSSGLTNALSTARPADYSKRYLANIPKRYYVTKQQFLEADFTRNVFGSGAAAAAGRDDNVYSEPYARVSTMPNMRAHRRPESRAGVGQRRSGATGAAAGIYRTLDQRQHRKGVPPPMCSTLPPPQRLNHKHGEHCFQRRYQRAENSGGWRQRHPPVQPQQPMHDTLPPDWPRQLRRQRQKELEEDAMFEQQRCCAKNPMSNERSFPSTWCSSDGWQRKQKVMAVIAAEFGIIE